jgi:hypothetical protein
VFSASPKERVTFCLTTSTALDHGFRIRRLRSLKKDSQAQAALEVKRQAPLAISSALAAMDRCTAVVVALEVSAERTAATLTLFPEALAAAATAADQLASLAAATVDTKSTSCQCNAAAAVGTILAAASGGQQLEVSRYYGEKSQTNE